MGFTLPAAEEWRGYLRGPAAAGGSSPRMSSGIRLQADASSLISLRRPAGCDRARIAVRQRLRFRCWCGTVAMGSMLRAGQVERAFYRILVAQWGVMPVGC